MFVSICSVSESGTRCLCWCVRFLAMGWDDCVCVFSS
jgi:hypothetical protein